MPRCFISLYGLNRSLRWTWRSIDSKFLAPLNRANIEPTLVCHFHRPDTISNLRSGEVGAYAGDTGHSNLPIAVFRQDKQELSVVPADVRHLAGPIFPDDTDEACQSRCNLLFQLRSLSQVWQMVLALDPNPEDIFLFLRPDLEYLDELDVPDLLNRFGRDRCDILTADWHEWGGLNDRFSFCNWRGAEVYANRIAHAAKSAQVNQRLHAETLLKDVVEQENLIHGHTSVRAMRVRADGFVLREGFTLSRARNLKISANNLLTRLHRRMGAMRFLPSATQKGNAALQCRSADQHHF